MDLQAILKTRFFYLQIGIDMFDFLTQSSALFWAFEVITEKGRNILNQLPRLLAVFADHGLQRIEYIKQKVRIYLGME